MAEDWAHACRIEAFFGEITQRMGANRRSDGSTLAPHEIERLEGHLRRARELLGGTDALARFQKWKTPEERLDRGCGVVQGPGGSV